jgi:hypothetical protein
VFRRDEILDDQESIPSEIRELVRREFDHGEPLCRSALLPCNLAAGI